MEIEQNQFEEIKKQLVPNFDLLDPHVQHDLTSILQIITHSSCTRQQVAHISRLNLLEETPILRSHLWKILLGAMSIHWNHWNHTKQNNYQLYSTLRQNFCPALIQQNNGIFTLEMEGFDMQLWRQIVTDTRRTHSTINFFQSDTSLASVYSSIKTKHSDIMTRILYIWSKTNSSVRYVQGMNQIIAPLFYLQFQQPDAQTVNWNRQSEVFAMFSVIICELIDMHTKEMDDCQNGILSRIGYLNRYLRILDQKLWNKLKQQGIFPQSYSFKWLALFLAQQFDIHDTIRLWDCVLSYPEQKRLFFVNSICIAILQLRRQYIMDYDFTCSLPMLQRLRDLEIIHVLKIGTQLFNQNQCLSVNEQYQRRFHETKNKSKWTYYSVLSNAAKYFTNGSTERKKLFP